MYQKLFPLIVLLLRSVILVPAVVSGQSSTELCGDSSWTVYTDTKCIKVIQTSKTYQEAHDLCTAEIGKPDPTPLLTIRSREEQDFFAKLIFNNLQIVDNVWLGSTRISGGSDFQWSDGSTLDFSNWAPSSPSNIPEKNCTQLTSQFSKTSSSVSVVINNEDGLWTDTSCLKRNFVVCQKAQNWSTSELQKALLLLRTELEKTNKRMEWQEQNPVPIGFLYTELPGHPDPSLIWPGVTWTDVSSSHAGNFFRVAGGPAAPFGTPQPASSGGIREVRTRWEQHSHLATVVTTKEPSYSSWRTGSVWIGDDYPDDGKSPLVMDFLVSSEEPRPLNQAVRIWKRTA